MAKLTGAARDLALHRFASSRIARLATIRPDGKPHVVPITFAIDGDTIVSAVDQKPKKHQRLQRLRNIEATGHASVIADHWDEDWDRLWWVRIDGAALVVAEDREAIVALATKYAQYHDDPPRGPVIRIAVASVSAWGPTQV